MKEKIKITPFCDPSGTPLKIGDYVFYGYQGLNIVYKDSVGVIKKLFKDTAVIAWNIKALPTFVHLSRIYKAEPEDII